MTLEEARELVPTKVWAKCAVRTCSHSWKIRRGDAFMCPYCGNAPKQVVMDRSLLWLPDDGTPRD